LEVRVEFLIENPPCKEGQPPDILLEPALRAEKRPRLGYSLNDFLIQRKQSIGKMDKWERLILNYDE